MNNFIKAKTYVREQPTLKNPDRICTICGNSYKAVAPLQKTCSEGCRKIKNHKHQRDFKERNPGAMKSYNKRRVEKDPDVWRKKSNKERMMIIEQLGSKCLVPNCSISNPLHLHIDYIPTMIGTGFRHPRHIKWVLDNIKDFRLLCANHHYELTITGKIEGSTITQKVKYEK